MARPKPKFKIGERVTVCFTKPADAVIVARGWTPMQAPQIVYRVLMDKPRKPNIFWSPQPITSGPHNEQPIPGELQHGEEEFYEHSLQQPENVVERLGNLARGDPRPG